MDKKIEIEFSELLNSNSKIINRVCCLYIDTEEDRKDLHQEICLQLWRSYGNFEGKSAVSTWLYKVALNTAITFFKKDKKQNQQTSQCFEFQSVIDDDVEEEKREQIEKMYEAINQLDRMEKALVTLYLDDKSYKEVSEILGISSVNARVKIVRIKEKLKNMLNG